MRDFFDLDYAVQDLGLKPDDAELIALVRDKVQIAGNDPADVSASRLAALRQQLEPQLDPALRDAVEALYTSDETKRHFENLARQVFIRLKTLLMEPSVFAYAERHDNIEAIYKKLQEKRDTADVTSCVSAKRKRRFC